MIQLNPSVTVAILAAGAFLTLFGMLDWVGYVSWGISPYVFFIGAVMIVAGAALAHLDISGHKDVFEEYDSQGSLRESREGNK